jgi:hypothetical protein
MALYSCHLELTLTHRAKVTLTTPVLNTLHLLLNRVASSAHFLVRHVGKSNATAILAFIRLPNRNVEYI